MSSSLENDDLVRAFKALAHPNRLAIYLTLLEQEEAHIKSCNLSQLVDRLDIGAPTVSHHTRELLNAGLIHVSRRGKFLHCQLNETMRSHLADFFGSTHSVDNGDSHGSSS